ncbi:MAG: hypothetical protein JST18_13355 [Bacteroidetes bacterium]|nr:hypothetical protein [Bacteroidota bacterium]
MATLGFFTPITFNNLPKSFLQSLLENVDSYFPQPEKTAHVVQGEAVGGREGVVLSKGTSSSCLVTALKVASYFTIVIPLILLAAKAILRQVHHFHLIDTAQRVRAGISDQELENAAAAIGQQNLDIRSREDTGQIHWINRNVFTLTAFPNLIFKIPQDHSRFKNMVEAQNVCLAHQLDCLIVPHARPVRVGPHLIIVERRLDIQSDESAQEDLYRLPGLDETIRQLAIFTALTGFSDVTWRNIPLIDTANDFEGNRKIALIDLEEMRSARTGFFGAAWPFRRGLVDCLHSAEHIDIALAEARNHNVRGHYAEIKARRLQEIEEDGRLQQFHERTGCLNDPRKLIEVADLASLELLNLEEEGEIVFYNESDDTDEIVKIQKKVTLREVTLDVIRLINEALAKTPEDASVKGKRYILLGVNQGIMHAYQNLGYLSHVPYDSEDDQRQWLRRIINALVEKGHLFKLDMVNGHGFFIQA